MDRLPRRRRSVGVSEARASTGRGTRRLAPGSCHWQGGRGFKFRICDRRDPSTGVCIRPSRRLSVSPSRSRCWARIDIHLHNPPTARSRGRGRMADGPPSTSGLGFPRTRPTCRREGDPGRSFSRANRGWKPGINIRGRKMAGIAEMGARRQCRLVRNHGGRFCRWPNAAVRAASSFSLGYPRVRGIRAPSTEMALSPEPEPGLGRRDPPLDPRTRILHPVEEKRSNPLT